MEHTKAAFRAAREMVGMTQAALADALGVEVRSVKRWESLDAPQEPPQDAWGVLGDAKREQDSLIGATLDAVERVKAAMGHYPGSYRMVYWTSQRQWDRYRVGPQADWRMANAASRAIAVVLAERGVEVEWTDTPQSQATPTPDATRARP